MNERKRKIYLVIIGTISLLSTYQFINVFAKFRFLFVDILNNISQSVVIYMLFVLLISITSYIALIYNWELLKKSNQYSDTNVLDNNDIMKLKEIGWKHYVYLVFGLLIVGLGVFLILKPLQESYPIEKLPNGIIPYFITLIITGLGVILVNDGIKIRAEIVMVNINSKNNE